MKKVCIFIGVLLSTTFSGQILANDSLTVNAQIENKVAYIVSDSLSDKLADVRSNEKSGTANNGIRQIERFTVRTSNTNRSKIADENPLLTFIQNYNIDSTRIYPKPARVFFPDEVLDIPKMSPLFMPLVFNSIHREYKIRRSIKEQSAESFTTPLIDSIKSINNANNYTDKLTRKILLDAETRYIGLIKYNQEDLPKPENLVFYLQSSIQSPWAKRIEPETSESGGKANTKKLPKTEYNPWSTDGHLKLQFSQTYNSPNWSKGGESNMAGLTTLYLEANYADLKSIQFDNYIEAKIGLNTVSSDSLRNLNVSTDQLKMVTKLGVKMHNDFYYSLSGEFTTQFLNNYKANTMTLKSSFMSPAKLFIGLGVDYKKADKKKGYNLSVLLTPLTYKMSYLYDNVNLNTSSYGIDKGKHFGHELGSKLTSSLTWKFSDQIQWKSNYYYYTDFTYTDTDWENTLDMSLSRNLTASIYLHLKMDDRLDRDPGESLIQMQELFSFGLAYRL